MAWGSLQRGSTGQRDRMATVLYYMRKKNRLRRIAANSGGSGGSGVATPAFFTPSNGGKTFTSIAQTAGRGVVNWSTTHNAGKRYLEMPIVTAFSDNYFIGLANTDIVTTDTSPLTSSDMSITLTHALLVVNSVSQAVSFPGDPKGHTMRLAIDMDAHKFWMALDNGNWLADPTANPVTGVNGLPYNPATLHPFFSSPSDPGATWETTFRAVTADMAFTVPTGYTPWDE